MPLVASNRVGTEQDVRWDGSESAITFYGSSFIADPTGKIVASASATDTQIIHHTFDLGAIARQRTSWGVFRDRRPDKYSKLLSSDGSDGISS